jgi:hypothetical protein
MKSFKMKSALLTSVVLVSLSCFVYVNTASVESAVTVEVNTLTVKASKNNNDSENPTKMWDLALIKSAFSLIQKFLPAK